MEKVSFTFNGFKATLTGNRLFITYSRGVKADAHALNETRTLAQALGVRLVESFDRKTLITVGRGR